MFNDFRHEVANVFFIAWRKFIGPRLEKFRQFLAPQANVGSIIRQTDVG